MSETNADPDYGSDSSEENESPRTAPRISPNAPEVSAQTVSSYGVSGHDRLNSTVAPRVGDLRITDAQMAYPDDGDCSPELLDSSISSLDYVRSQPTYPSPMADVLPFSHSSRAAYTLPAAYTLRTTTAFAELRGIGSHFRRFSPGQAMSVRHTSERVDNEALHMAAVNGHQQDARLLLDRGADIEDMDPERRTPLHIAALNGHHDVAGLLLDRGADIKHVDCESRTPLHLAALNGRQRVVSLLLHRGANVGARDTAAATPLHLAAKMYRDDVVRLLLDRGAHIEDADGEGRTPLHLAALNDRQQIVSLLLDRGANVDARDSTAATPLHLAAKMYRDDVARLLLDRGAHIEDADGEGRTPLHLAALNGHWNVASLLLDRGANVGARDTAAATPLHLLALNGHWNVVRLLLNRGANVDARDSTAATPLHLAALNGHWNVVRLLLDRGANVDARDTAAATPLHLVALNGYLNVVNLLLDRGADIEDADHEGRTPLHLAAFNGHWNVVRLLLNRGANVDARGTAAATPLHLAVMAKHDDIVGLLLDRGAYIEDVDLEGRTPLHLATLYGHEQAARLLLDSGADVEHRDHRGRTPLHLAALYGHEQAARLLLDRGAHIEHKDRRERTPLHLAALYGHEQTARLLLDSGADIERKDRRERTPLHLAAFSGHQQVARLLLDRCANLDAQDADAASPLSLALRTDTGPVVEYGCRKGVVAVLLYFEARPEPSDIEAAAHAGQFDIVRMLLAALGDVGTRSTRPTDKSEGKAIIEAILKESLESIALYEFGWLKDLIEEGVTFAEVAGMLLTADSSAEHVETAAGDADHQTDLRRTLPHLKNCLHDYGFDPHVGRQLYAGQCPADPFLEREEAAFSTNPASVNREQQALDHEIRQIFRRIWKPMPDISTPEGSAVSAVICYTLAADARDSYARIHEALDDVVLGIEKCNARGFSCDGFTILTRPASFRNAVKLTRVSISAVYKLQDALKHRLHLEHEVSKLLHPLGLNPEVLGREGRGDIESSEDCLARVIHMAAILAQIFSVGLMTYTGTHSSPISTVLGREVDSFTLTGLGGSDAGCQWQLQMTRQRLACFGDMIGSPVWVIHQLEAAGLFEKPSNLVASLEDIVDTWGRVYLEKSPEGGRFLGFRIGGGLVRPLGSEASSYAELAKNDSIPCHWERSLPSDRAPLPPTTGIGFRPADLLCIGALSENNQCTFDEAKGFREARPFLAKLAVNSSWWKTEQRTAQVQVGQYVNVIVAGVQKRIEGVSLKAAIWDEWHGLKDLTLLAAPWGLQFSLCTGAARRVSLKELFRDRVIDFAAAMKPQEWSRIESDYQNIFVGTTVSEFCARATTLRQTRPEDYSALWEVCNVALCVLHSTGPTPSGDALKIWWPSRNGTQNETLGLQVGENWATLFKDNPEQAIFAASTPTCLCLGQRIACRVPWSWDYRIHYLETTVAVDMTYEERYRPPPPSDQDWILEGNWYALGEGFLVVSRAGMNAPGLSARWKGWRLIPEQVRRKLVKRYLREITHCEENPSWELLVTVKKQ